MKRFFFYFVILLFAVLLGVAIHKDPGYVLVTYQNWSVETTLWFALIVILLLFFILYIFLRFLRGTSRLSERWKNWSRKRRIQNANKYTFQGLSELAEGNWNHAEKTLIRGIKNNETPLINYLASASAAQQQGHFEERDNYLRLAHEHSPQADVAIALTQARLQVEAEQWELALATLRRLQQIAPHHNYVLKLLKTVYLQLHDWEGLQQLLPELNKYRVLKENKLLQLEHQIYFKRLQTAILNNGDSSTIHGIWQSAPKMLQQDPEMLVLYVNFLLQKKEINKAEVLIRDALKKHWDSSLITLYSEIKSDSLEKQISQAESWLKNHPNDPDLLLCLGKLYAYNENWDKARKFFSASIQNEPQTETYRELGKLYEVFNDPQTAISYYRKALGVTTTRRG